uniref:Interleukin-17 receptor C/E N-terminal domain-containing protein n=1 Tax=Lepisosteus oculatus TaxID=7918 RepID=W5NB63_LEPOC
LQLWFIPARADDLWRSSTIHFLGQRSGSTLTLRWDSPCPLPDSSASLCWRDSETAPSACRVIVNSTLKREGSVYTISGVDRHPQLCVQLSYKDSYHVECPFGPGDTDWTAEVTPAGSFQHLRITSGVPASFSAGLCRREEGRCVPVAPVHSASLDSSSNATELRMTLSSPGPWLCVQVWRTDVAFSAKTLLCPYSECLFCCQEWARDWEQGVQSRQPSNGADQLCCPPAPVSWLGPCLFQREGVLLCGVCVFSRVSCWCLLGVLTSSHFTKKNRSSVRSCPGLP